MSKQHLIEMRQNNAEMARLEKAMAGLQAQKATEVAVVTQDADIHSHLDQLNTKISNLHSLFANPFLGAEFGRQVNEMVSDSMRQLDKDSSKTSNLKAPLTSGEAQLGRLRSPITTQSMVNSIFGTIDSTSIAYYVANDCSQPDDDRLRISRTNIRLTPARWMVRWGFNVALAAQVSRSSQAGWQTKLRTFNVRPVVYNGRNV